MKRKAIGSLVFRLWVHEFYRINSGFFIVCSLLYFTLGNSDYQHVLVGFAVEHPLVLVGGFFLPGLLYALKTIAFGRRLLASPDHIFFRNLLLYPFFRKWFILLRLHFWQLLPVFFFGFDFWMTAYFNDHPARASLILSFLLLLWLAGPLCWMHDLRRPADASGQGSQYFRYRKEWTGWLLRMLVETDGAKFFLTKLFSLLFLFGGMYMSEKYGYDGRFIWLAFLCLAYLHLGVIDALVKLGQSLKFFKNLPLSGFELRVFQLKQLLPLILPEILFFLAYFPIGMGFFYHVFLFLWYPLLLMLLHEIRAVLSSFQGHREKIMPAAFFTLAILIMFRMHPLLLISALAVLIRFLHRRYYFQTEYVVKTN